VQYVYWEHLGTPHFSVAWVVFFLENLKTSQLESWRAFKNKTGVRTENTENAEGRFTLGMPRAPVEPNKKAGDLLPLFLKYTEFLRKVVGRSLMTRTLGQDPIIGLCAVVTQPKQFQDIVF